MTTLGANFPTLIDTIKREDPDGRVAKIIEQVAKRNDILQDAIYVECNDGSKHQTTMRTGIPEPTFRKFNAGVQPSKSTTVQVTDTTGMAEDYSLVDKALVMKYGDAGAAFRASEAAAKLQGFNNKMSRYMFYGDTDAEPEAFLGLSPRFSSLAAASGANIVNGGGSGADNTSIWFVTWGEDTCHLIYPKGSLAGFQHKDLGEDRVEDGNGGYYQALVDHFKWDLGMSVRDWRGISRVANIDVSDMNSFGSGTDTSEDLINLMIEAYYNLDNPEQGGGRTAIYCNKRVLTILHKMAMSKANVNLTIEEYGGKPVTMFLGHPIRRNDEIKLTEAAVA